MKCKHAIIICTAVAVVIAAAVIAVNTQKQPHLCIENTDTGELCAAFQMPENGMFSVEFVHSVNKSPVRDIYELRGREIYLIETHYYDFGAGVPSELGPGETLNYGYDGSMQVKGIDRRVGDLIYIVGTVSDHVLRLGGEEISLRELCGLNSSVRLTLKNMRK